MRWARILDKLRFMMVLVSGFLLLSGLQGTRSGASVHSPAVPVHEVESAPAMTREPLVKRHEEDSREESKGLSSTEIEAALTDIAKSVAQLTMVVANLDSKISSLEKVAPSDVSRFGSSTLEASQKNKILDDAATSPAFTEAEPKQNGTYRIQKSVVDENVAQLKWEEAVFKDKSIYETKSQLLKGEILDDTCLCIFFCVYDEYGNGLLLVHLVPRIQANVCTCHSRI